MNRTIRHAAIAAASLATAVTLAACGNAGGSGSNDHQNMPGMPGMSGSSSPASSSPGTAANPASGPHNAADVAFATGMIPHHEQAITMAEMATSKATNPQVKSLAAAIKTAQGPEIATMRGWLAGWGQPVPPTTGGHDMSAMGGTAGTTGTTGMTGSTGMTGMTGMMTEQEMQQLSSAAGAAFDRMWVQMMIEHHQGAVTMSQAELANGQNGNAKQLAQEIIDAQNKEIDTMTALLPTITG